MFPMIIIFPPFTIQDTVNREFFNITFLIMGAPKKCIQFEISAFVKSYLIFNGAVAVIEEEFTPLETSGKIRDKHRETVNTKQPSTWSPEFLFKGTVQI